MNANLIKILRCQKRNRHEKAAQVTWERPEQGWTKLNFDGSFREKTGAGTIGGAFRNHRAEFILGYSEPIGKTTSTLAELYALRRGLELALENGWDNVWLEGDPKTLVDLILSRRRANSGQVQRLVNDINLIIPELNNCRLSHIYREGNRLAHMFAQMGHESNQPRLWQDHPPVELVHILRDDAAGKSILRKR